MHNAYENSKLSWGAKGLLGYLLALPTTNEIEMGVISKIYKGKRSGSGISAIRGFVKELLQEKYLIYDKVRDSKGQWIHRYDVYPSPFVKLMFSTHKKTGAE